MSGNLGSLSEGLRAAERRQRTYRSTTERQLMAIPLLSDHWECTGQQQAQRYPHPHVKAAGVYIRHLPSTFKTSVGSSLPVHLKRWPLLSHAFQGRHWLLTWKTLSWDGVFGPLLDYKQSR